MRKTTIIFLMLLLLGMTLFACNEEDLSLNKNIHISQFSIDQFQDSSGVKAIFFESDKNDYHSFMIYGHTDYSEKGTDIVAAGVSSLAIAIVNAFEMVDVEYDLTLEEVHSKPYMALSINKYKTEKAKIESSILLKTLESGLQGIEDVYGTDYVEVMVIENK